MNERLTVREASRPRVQACELGDGRLALFDKNAGDDAHLLGHPVSVDP